MKYAATLGEGMGTAKRSRPLVGTFALNFSLFLSFLSREKKETDKTVAGLKIGSYNSTSRDHYCTTTSKAPVLIVAFAPPVVFTTPLNVPMSSFVELL